jgi:hypothetical protein
VMHGPMASAIQRRERRGPRPEASLLGLAQEGERGGGDWAPALLGYSSVRREPAGHTEGRRE